MATIPRRVAQHGVYIPGPETLPVALKPGQVVSRRQDVYAAEAKPLADTYIQEIGPKDYIKKSQTNTEDYLETTKLCRPRRWVPEDGSGGSHWLSEAQGAAELGSTIEPGRRYAKARRCLPPYILTTGAPTCFAREEDVSVHRHSYGRYHSNPRDRLTSGQTKLPFFRDELSMGTTRGTSHIPGYQGFISVVDGEITQGETPRLVNKTNMAETYHTNLVGYAGHVPASARNDFGGRRRTRLTSHGRDFTTPRASTAP